MKNKESIMKEIKHYDSPVAKIVQLRIRLCNVEGSPYGNEGYAGNYDSSQDDDNYGDF